MEYNCNSGRKNRKLNCKAEACNENYFESENGKCDRSVKRYNFICYVKIKKV